MAATILTPIAQQERGSSTRLEPVEQSMPPARLILTSESWNEVVRLVEAAPEPTDELLSLFRDER